MLSNEVLEQMKNVKTEAELRSLLAKYKINLPEAKIQMYAAKLGQEATPDDLEISCDGCGMPHCIAQCPDGSSN